MSKKRNRGKGGRSLSSDNGAVRKQKAAQYADKTLKPHIAENSPMGSAEKENVSDGAVLDNFTEEADSGNNAPNKSASEPRDGRRLKKAAAMKMAAESKIAESRKTDAACEAESVSEADLSETPKAETEQEVGRAENDTSQRENTERLDPQTEKRLKKAAYIKQMNEAKIAAEKVPADEEECTEETAEEQDEAEEISEDSSISEAENMPAEEVDSSDNSELKEAFVKKYAAEQFEKGKNNKRNIPKGFVLEAAKETADFVSAVQSGDAAKVVALPVKKVIEKKFGESKALRKAKVVTSAVKSSDSVGGAAAGIGTAIAADKVKQYARGLIFGRPDKKSRQRAEKKYRHIKREKTANTESTEKAAKSQRYKVKSVEKTQPPRKIYSVNFI